MKIIKFITIFPLVVFLISFLSCSSGNKTEEYFTMDDFNKIDKIDAHCHITSDRPDFMDQAKEDNFRILTIMGDGADGLSLEQQEAIIHDLMKKYPGRLNYLTGFSMKGWGEPGWQEKTLGWLKKSFGNGAAGLKVWKNIGMEERDRDGNFIMIDDASFDPIFSYMEQKGIPLCGHLGEPKNCWLPVDQMTVNNDKKYFTENPKYHMYLHPDYPSYEDQIRARDHMLEKHPDLRFMGAHLGSMEWSVDMMAEHFDRFPNMTVDLAERVCHLEVQARKDRQKVRDFMIKYQDRIIYGTDRGDYGGVPRDEIRTRAHESWINDWKFFTTGDTISAWEVDGEFRGLKLPKEVVEKIYYKNAEKLFKEFGR